MVLKLSKFQVNKDNPKGDLQELVRLVKPSWKLDNVTIEDVVGGFSSKMFKCFQNDSPDDAILIRVKNLMDQFEEWQGNFEIEVLEHLSKIGHFSEIHALFENGYCYQYILGNPVLNIKLKTGLITDEILKAIAKEMAFIHCIKLPNVEHTQSNFFEKMKITVQKSKFESRRPRAPIKQTILKEFEIVDSYLKSLNTPISLSHGDTHPGNMVWNETTKKLTYVDWELTRIGYQFQDIAYFIVMLKTLDSDIMPDMKLEITDNAEEKFLAFYFQAWMKEKEEKETDKSFKEFVQSVQKFKLCPLLVSITFGIILPDLLNEVAGESKFFESWLNSYFETKQAIFGIDQFG